MKLSGIQLSEKLWKPAIVVSILLLGIIGQYARNWNPAVSYDTCLFYYPKIALLNWTPPLQAVNGAFLVPAGKADPTAAEAKPVFVALLDVWHSLYRLLATRPVSFPDNKAYSDFIFVCLVTAFLAVIWLGRTMGHPWLGLLSGLIAFINPWAITAVYYNSYTALSLSLLCVAWGLILKGRKSANLLAGILMTADLLLNQSTAVFTMAFAAVILLRSKAVKNAITMVLYYAGGMLAAWGCVELLILANNLHSAWAFRSEAGVIWAYLKRSMTERTEYFGAYRGSLFPFMLWHYSWPYALAFLAALTLWATSFRKYGRALFARAEGVTGFLVLFVLLLIDIRTGPKFSRTYILLLPFATLFMTMVLFDLGVAIRKLRAAVLSCFATLLLIHATGVLLDLRNQKAAFLNVREKLMGSNPGDRPAFLLRADSYLPWLYQLIEGEPCLKRPFEQMVIRSLCDPPERFAGSAILVLVGPNIPSLLKFPGVYSSSVDLELQPGATSCSGTCSNIQWTAQLKERVPFFSNYPYLVLEDPEETFKMKQEHVFGWNAYLDGIGSASLWEVTYGPVRRALEINPVFPQARYHPGTPPLRGKSVDDAIAQYQKALQSQPGVPETHFNLAEVLFRKGSVTEAIAHYQKALEINPDYVEARRNLGIALFQQGRVNEATTLFRYALQRQPNNADAHNNLGVALQQQGKLDDAVKQFQEAIRLDPAMAFPYCNLGKVRVLQGKMVAAMALLKQAGTLDPRLEEAHYNLGDACLLTGKLAEAIAELKTVVRLKPNHIEAQKKLADALIKTGKATEAIPYCQAVVAAEPEDAHAHFTLGSACLAAQRPEQAAASFEAAVRLAPDTPECLNALAWIYATSPRAELRNGAAAVRLAEEACKITKRQKTATLDTLAAAYAETGRFDEAVKATEELRALAASAHDTNTADTARQRLELYEARKPYRDVP